VGLQLASNILVLTQGRDKEPNARKLSAYVGICPYGHRKQCIGDPAQAEMGLGV